MVCTCRLYGPGTVAGADAAGGGGGNPVAGVSDGTARIVPIINLTMM